MNKLNIRNIVLGEGSPKICVPIVGTTHIEIIEEAKSFSNIPLDIVELRIDFFEDVFNFEKVEFLLKDLRSALGETPILFTFRTKKEGGEKDIDIITYKNLNTHIAKTKLVDLIDIEGFTGDPIVQEIIDEVHSFEVKVILSNHDFLKTPSKEEIIARLVKMRELGGDILKIAVMPTSKKDVLTLLCATEEMNRLYGDRPLITMSMSSTGVISRITGECFGSCLTFAKAKKTSAPGQIDVNELRQMLNIIHSNI